MSRKLISVIIPTYNRSDLLAKAIQSVKDQTYPEIQIIVADDGSQDNTAEIVKQFEDVEYYYQENKGQGAARNLGLKYAKGEYIASLDSDDIWFEDFLENAADALERFEADFVFLNWTEYFGEKQQQSSWERDGMWKKFAGHRNGEWLLLDDKEVRRLFIDSCPAPSSALLIKRSSMVAGWSEEMKIADDWYLILEMIFNKPCRAAFTLKSHWKKHIHEDNIYHGRDPLKVLEEFGLHDEPLFAIRFNDLMTPSEKASLRRKQAVNHLHFVRLKLKQDGLSDVVFRSSLKTLRFTTIAFTHAPLSSVSYLVHLCRDHLKNRMSIAQAKREEIENPKKIELSSSLDTALKSETER